MLGCSLQAEDKVFFKMSNGRLMVLDKAECGANEDEILDTYAVPYPFSADLEGDGAAAVAPKKASAKRKDKAKADVPPARRGKKK